MSLLLCRFSTAGLMVYPRAEAAGGRKAPRHEIAAGGSAVAVPRAMGILTRALACIGGAAAAAPSILPRRRHLHRDLVEQRTRSAALRIVFERALRAVFVSMRKRDCRQRAGSDDLDCCGCW